MKHARYKIAGLVSALAVTVVVLMWPVGTWLRHVGLRPARGVVPDAVYLVTGARHQNRRIVALTDYLAGLPSAPASILVGNDPQAGRWSADERRTLCVTEWAVRKFTAQGLAGVEVVPGAFSGTDGEMRDLARYLGDRPRIRTLAIVTSPFHIRRAVWRLRRHLGRGVAITAICPRATPGDRAPWVVLGELAKMSRDALGLSRVPFLNRGSHNATRFDWVEAGILIGAGLLAYAWILYPALLRPIARLARRRRASRRHEGGETTDAGSAGCRRPEVTILFSAHNEERHIEARLRNLVDAAAGAGRDDIRVFVGIDASTDRTTEIATEFGKKHPGVRVCDFAQRRGKPAVLKDLVRRSGEERGSAGEGEDSGGAGGAAAKTEILVFTDANTFFEPDALEKLVRHFANPEVGGVCGRLVFVDTAEGEDNGKQSSPEGLYWRWENALKERESAVDSCLGANGAIYAIRRYLFWRDMPDNTIVDDFVVGMKVREQGYRMIYEPLAVACEELPAGSGDEWQRRVRIGAGDFQALVLCGRCLLPRYGRFAWQFWSHKVLRWFTPHLLLLLALVSASSVLCCLPALRSRGEVGPPVFCPLPALRSPQGGAGSSACPTKPNGEVGSSGSSPHCSLFTVHSSPPSSLRAGGPTGPEAVVCPPSGPEALQGRRLSSVLPPGRRPYRAGGCRPSSVVCIGFAVFLLLALSGYVVERLGWRVPALLRACRHFLSMQAAILVGFMRFCGGGLEGHWPRTAR